MATPTPPLPPSVTLDVPDEVLIGDTFKFTVTFYPTNAVGYGPFIDLVLPAGGIDYNDLDPSGNPGPCDGVTYVPGSAQMIGVNGGPIPLTTDVVSAPCNHTTAGACETLTHPYAANGISSVAFPNISVPEGAQLVTIKLPFGSFEPNQPPIVIQITAKLSDHADVNAPLDIYARAGFQFGTTPNDDFNTDPPANRLSPGGVTNCAVWTAAAQVTPVLFTFRVEDRLSAAPGPCYDGLDNGSNNLTDSKDPDCQHAKTYIGPEDETATGPNYPRQYKIILDIATGQKVSNLTIKDCLPNNVVFTGMVASQTVPTPNPVPSQTGPQNANCLSFTYPNPIVGTSATTDIVIVFEFYVPQSDANAQPVLDPATCANATSPNDVKASGDWTPIDLRDPVTTITSDTATVDHLLTDKRIAIQKSVETYPVPNAPMIPGSVLKYTLSFQVSDFFTVGHIVLTDLLSDGQDLIAAPSAPQLIVSDRRGPTPTTVPFSSGLDILDLTNPVANCGGVHGGRNLIFQVSAAMQNHASLFTDPVLKQGILTGGWALTPTSSIPATGKVEFYVVVRDKFIFPHPPGDQFVDKDDPINNCVSVSADMYTNDPTTPVPHVPQLRCADDSMTALAIVTDTITKSVYAIRRGTGFFCGGSSSPCPLPPAVPEVHPGDQVTFRVGKTIPSSDAESMTIEDWPPLPIFNIPPMSFANSACVGIPAPGSSCRGPLDTLHLLVPPAVPLFLPHPLTNSLYFDYGNFNDPNNGSGKIDLLFTSTVTNQPFADGLFMTNEAQECENNTFGVRFCQAAIAQVNLREPHLRIRKGIIATNNPNAVFTQPASPQTTPNPTATPPPNAALSLTGMSGIVNTSAMVSSNDLAAGFLDSNLPSGVDANDIVTFAITIENLGGHPAYDVKVEDMIPHDSNGNPTCFTILPSTIQVKRGTGATVNPLLYNIAPAVPTTTGFTVTSTPFLPIPINAYDPTSGKNIIVITFQAKLLADIMPGCCDNKAEIKHYASQLNGPDFVTAGFTPPFSDIATVCVKPTLTKSLVFTSEPHTTASNVTIGEIARYRLEVVLPEGGLLPNFQVADALPAGMKFLNDGSARIAFVSNGPGITRTALLNSSYNVNSNAPPSSSALTALPPIPTGVISVGSNCGDDPVFNLLNVQNNDNDFDLEYIVVEFNALVCNEAGNQSGTTLPNTFSVSSNGNLIATSNPINVIIVEPNLTMTKTVAPNPAVKGQTLTYTVQYTNNGTADAFDVELKDTLPPGLTLGTITASCPFTSVGNVITMTCAQVPKAPGSGSTVIVTYQAVANPVSCPVTLNNRANLTWTSLPGLQGTTVNPTGSSTPGNSGAVDGERDGVTPLLTLNDYLTTASAAVKIDCPCEATITGLKFNDLNGNGVRDTGEPGLANWTIQVTDSNGITHTTTTDSQGNYSLTVPAPGTYTVAEVLQSGWTQTAPTSGTYSVTVSPGQVINNRDFGNRLEKPKCDLQIKKEMKPNPLVSGQQATATITVKNVGAGPCHGPTKVAESMPAGLTLVSATVPGGSCVLSTGVCNYAPAIPAGGSVVFTYVFNVTAQPGASFENCAKLKNSEDTNPTNNGMCVPLTVIGVKPPTCPFIAGHAGNFSTIPTFDFGTGTTTAQFVTGASDDRGRGMEVVSGLACWNTTVVYYTSISGDIHVAPYAGGSGGPDITVLPNPRQGGNGIQDLDYRNGVLYAMTGYNAGNGGVPIVYSLNPCTGAVLSSVNIVSSSRNSDGFTVLPSGDFLINDGDGSTTYRAYSSTTGAPTGLVITLPASGATGVDYNPPDNSLYFFANFVGTRKLARTDLSGNLLGTIPVAWTGSFIEDISVLPCAPSLTGSLAVTKTVKNLSPIPFPSGTNFPITVSCLPSGPNVTLNLAAGGTQTVNNIPVGSTCTVTEGALPPPIPHPACPSLEWGTPAYAPGQTVTIPSTGGSQTVTVTNTYFCNTTPTCATPPPGMVAWWPLDETSGNVVHSIVGNHDGITQSGPIGSGGPSVAAAPKVGSALFFGMNKAEVPDDPALNFGTGDFSIDAWVRSSQSTLLSAIVDKLDTSTTTHRGYAFFVQNGMVQLRIGDGVNTGTYQSSNTFVADGTWRHVAVTMRRAGGTPVGQFYIDGVPAGGSFAPLAINLDNSAKLLIGSFRLGNNACSCEVSLDEIEMFNTAVKPADIKSIFQADKKGKCKATITGSKYNDLNGNGVRNPGEPGLANWTIRVTDSSGSTQTTTTDSAGDYSLTVAPGTYAVAEILQSGWTQTAPTTGTYAVTVSGSQVVNNRDFGNKKQCAAIALSPAVLPAAGINTPYSQAFTATGGCASSFTYSVTRGALPIGLTLGANGVLSGTATQPGDFTFNVTATDSCGCSQSQTYTLKVNCPTVPLRLFNTGVADNGSLLADGDIDPHYSLILPNGNAASAQVLAPAPSSFVSNNATSKWIGPGNDSQPVGVYIYRVSFTLTDCDPESVTIKGRWSSDNQAVIRVNGLDTNITTRNDSFKSFSKFVLDQSTAKFRPGLNTLDFVVTNTEFNTGLRVEMSGTFKCCPATGSLTVTKTVENLSPSPIPAGTSFPVTVSCLPSGPNVTLNFVAGETQTLNNIPVGSKCTVTEGPLPAPISSPVCGSLQWSAPSYSPGQNVTIPNSGAPQTVTIQNRLVCLHNHPVDAYAFKRGMNEFCIWGGGGSGSYNPPNLIGNPDSPRGFNSPTLVGTGGVRYGAIGLCYGRILTANDKVAFKYTFNAVPVAGLSYPDVNPVFIDRPGQIPVSATRRNVFGGGLSPIGLQLYFRPQDRIKPFVSTSGGFIFFNEQVPRLNGARFNFTYDVGGGVQVFRDSRRAFTFGYKYQRLSNGGRALNNPGFNGNVFSFGYSIFKTPRTAQSP
jgi:uncharacterized repeat protein (TIGR01451 family)